MFFQNNLCNLRRLCWLGYLIKRKLVYTVDIVTKRKCWKLFWSGYKVSTFKVIIDFPSLCKTEIKLCVCLLRNLKWQNLCLILKEVQIFWETIQVLSAILHFFVVSYWSQILYNTIVSNPDEVGTEKSIRRIKHFMLIAINN